MTRTRAIAIGLFLIVLLSRVPFASQTLWAHDSVLYANAMEHGFHVDDDLAQQRPHPPGYILYVATAGVARAAGLGSNDALVLVSALASALAAVALFLLTRRWTTDAIALIAAVGFAANPLVWQYSEIAYPYAVLALSSIVVASCCLHARGRGLRAGILASIAFGIAGGFRQDLLILLLPLWGWSVAPLGPRRGAIAAASVALAVMAWLVPTVALSGGIGEYFDALQSQAAYVRETYSIAGQGVPAFVANLAATSWAAWWGLLLMAPLVLGTTVVALRRRWRARRLDAGFALLWTLPPLAVYVLLHIGDWGYILSALPGLYLLGARALQTLTSAFASGRRLTLAASWGTLAIAPAALFMWGSLPFSAARLSAHDGELAARVSYVRENYQPKGTLILTREDYLLVRYYLPEYRARQYDPEPFTQSSMRMRARRVDRVVVFTAGLVPDRQLDVRHVQCKKGVELVYMDVTPDSVLEFKGERYAVAHRSPRGALGARSDDL
jgi:hypothetical protein